MALVLGLGVGHQFKVGDMRFKVIRLLEGNKFRLRRYSTPRQEFEITDRHGEEVLPGVFVSSGFETHPLTARVVIDAPLEVKITRLGRG